MIEATRRSFLQTTLLSACGLAGSAWTRAQTVSGTVGILDRTGVALFTVRDLMKDPAPTLEAIAKLGYRYVEGALVPSLAPAVKAAGLEQLSAYAPTYLVTGNRQAWAGGGPLLPESYTWEQAVAEAKGRGLQYLVIAYLQKAERGGLDDYRRLGAKLDNEAKSLTAKTQEARTKLTEAVKLREADTAAMKKRETEMAAQFEAVNQKSLDSQNQAVRKSQEAQAVRAEAEKRREDVFRLKRELDEIRVDLFRTVEQLKKLQDHKIRLDGVIGPLERRQEQLKTKSP